MPDNEGRRGRNIIELPRSISDQVYELIKDQILDQELLPGQRLRELTITQSMQVSRTPVREAFRRLEQDGLVARLPQGGVRVTEMSMETLSEICEIRAILEAYAVERACRNVDPETIAELKEIMAQARSVMDRQDGKAVDVMELNRLNTFFHDRICKAAQSEYLHKLLQDVRLPILRFRPVSLQDVEHRQRGWQEHTKMIELLQAGAVEELKRLVIKHAQDVGDAVMRTLSNSQQTAER